VIKMQRHTKAGHEQGSVIRAANMRDLMASTARSSSAPHSRHCGGKSTTGRRQPTVTGPPISGAWRMATGRRQPISPQRPASKEFSMRSCPLGLIGGAWIGRAT
jgi:hypothetical protein